MLCGVRCVVSYRVALQRVVKWCVLVWRGVVWQGEVGEMSECLGGYPSKLFNAREHEPTSVRARACSRE